MLLGFVLFCFVPLDETGRQEGLDLDIFLPHMEGVTELELDISLLLDQLGSDNTLAG